MTALVRRRLALGLIAYGSIGLLILLASFFAIVGPLSTLSSIADDQAAAVRWLDLSEQALADAGRGSTNASTSLSTAAVAARNAASLATSLSGSMASLRDATTQSILGTQPFGSLTDDFDQVASQATSTAAGMTELAADLDRDQADFTTLAMDMSDLRDRLGSLREAVSAVSSTDLTSKMTAILAMISLLLLWLAVPASLALIVGLLMIRSSSIFPAER